MGVLKKSATVIKLAVVSRATKPRVHKWSWHLVAVTRPHPYGVKTTFLVDRMTVTIKFKISSSLMTEAMCTRLLVAVQKTNDVRVRMVHQTMLLEVPTTATI